MRSKMENVDQFKQMDFITERSLNTTEMSWGFVLEDGEILRVFEKEKYGQGCTFGKCIWWKDR